MSDGKKVPATPGDKAKAERLAAALRANLKRRKAKVRAKDEEQQTDKVAPEKEDENA